MGTMEDRLLTLRREDFESLVDQPFTFHAPSGQALATRLAEVRGLGSPAAPAAQRGPFALVFASDLPAPLPQQIVRVENETLGGLEIFVVPIGPDPQGRMQYEAIFT
jgi:hypothetical protein